jgi:carbon-monoxide dehydrogenase large subunit
VSWVGRRLGRLDDARLLAGRGTFTDDLHLPGMLEATVLRSPVAHGTYRGLDTSAITDPDVVVLGPDAFLDRYSPIPVLWHLPEQFQHAHPVVDRTFRYLGEPVGVVVAPSRAAAEDAAALVRWDVDELPAVTDPHLAIADGAPLLYPEHGTNVMATWATGVGPDELRSVLDDADHVLHLDLDIGRVAGTPMETRGVVVEPPGPHDPRGKLTVWQSTQAPHAVRDFIAAVTDLPQHRIRVVGPDVGGGFGVKDHQGEDELLVILAALQLGRPVKWIEDRRESLTLTRHARDHRNRVTIAVDDDGRFRALHVDAVRNCGALFGMFGAGPLFATSGMFPAPYHWDAVRCDATAVATNLNPTGAYRGFGQTQAVYVRERAIDAAARHLGADPVALRLANLVGPEELPFQLQTAPLFLDSGDYPGAVRTAQDLAAGWDGPPDDGRVRGTGWSVYVQQSGIGPSGGNEAIGLDVGGFETADLRMEHDGTVRALLGTSCHGQGHETSFAQLIADATGIDPADVDLIHSDTDVTPYSPYGTAASRSMVVGGGATVRAARLLGEQLRGVAARMLEAEPDDIDLAGGRATVAGTSSWVPISAVAERAWQARSLPDGAEPGLVARVCHDPEDFTYNYAVHVCRVALDTETGLAEVERYGVVHDCGTLVNPTIVEGQIHGGVAQGLGAALLEEATFDDAGAPTSTTLLDYLVPVSSSVPDIQVVHTEHPSPTTPGGMKGMGEGGTNGSFACVANGVAAAVAAVDPAAADRLTSTPMSPATVWAALHPDP